MISPDLPLGLVTTISHAPTLVVLGRSNVHFTLEDESQVTFVAVMLVSLERRSIAVRLVTKSDPVISVITAIPASPSSGSIPRIEGLAVDTAVVVVVETGDGVVVLVAVVVTMVVTVVGAAVGTDATGTCVILTVYIFSIIARVEVSVFEFMR